MDEELMDQMFSALSHSIRRKIILMAGNHQKISYTDLTELGVEAGTLYHHLDILLKADEPLLEKGRNKQYSLTQLGEAAYNLIVQGENQINWASKQHNKQSSAEKSLEFIGLDALVRRIQNDPYRFVLEVVILLGGYGYLASEVGLIPCLLFFLEGTFEPGLTILASFGSWILTYLLVEAISIPVLGGRKYDPALLLSVPLSYLPHTLVEMLWYSGPAAQSLTGWPLTLLLTLIISWSTLILTISVARAKKVRISQAAIVTLVSTNVNLILLAILATTSF
ncbi:MAG: winged helix-turn-helix transcriptional regulator [Candidatus Thorarchaeota archaeon]|nr:winged helix-turn-helix transcriptional regulator [Candidatus Thorarchaeota archaeon]